MCHPLGSIFIYFGEIHISFLLINKHLTDFIPTIILSNLYMNNQAENENAAQVAIFTIYVKSHLNSQ